MFLVLVAKFYMNLGVYHHHMPIYSASINEIFPVFSITRMCVLAVPFISV